MQDRSPPDQDLAPFFEAAQDEKHHLPEAARRRILLEAEALQPKPIPQPATPWSLFSLFRLLPAGAAMASLSLGIFIGMAQPDNISEWAGLSGQSEDASSLFGNGFESAFDESELNG